MTGVCIACGIVLFAVAAYVAAVIEHRRHKRELEAFVDDTTAMFDRLFSLPADSEEVPKLMAQLERRIDEEEPQ